MLLAGSCGPRHIGVSHARPLVLRVSAAARAAADTLSRVRAHYSTCAFTGTFTGRITGTITGTFIS